MATPLPFLSLPLSTQVPVTPPPERQGFPHSAPLLSPNFARPCSAEAYGLLAGAKPQGTGFSSVLSGVGGAQTATSNAGAAATSFPGKPPALDPQQLATVSRIAAYYQQQYQAMANHQHQQCQAWANMHRQRCQEMLKAAALVMTWYMRDRAVRRRKRRGRRFHRALSERCAGGGRVKKGDAVRKWIAAVPDRFVSPSSPVRDDFADADEAKFDIDRAATPDKELEFIHRTDDLFRSQLAKVNLPQFGPLSFEESDKSSSEDEADADVDVDIDSLVESEVGDEVEDEDMEFESEISEDDDLDEEEGDGGMGDQPRTSG